MRRFITDLTRRHWRYCISVLASRISAPHPTAGHPGARNWQPETCRRGACARSPRLRMTFDMPAGRSRCSAMGDPAGGAGRRTQACSSAKQQRDRVPGVPAPRAVVGAPAEVLQVGVRPSVTVWAAARARKNTSPQLVGDSAGRTLPVLPVHSRLRGAHCHWRLYGPTVYSCRREWPLSMMIRPGWARETTQVASTN